MLRAPRVIGRSAELDVLRRCVTPGSGGQPGGVAVVGPAGVGKSALARAAAGPGGDVLLGRATPSSQAGLSAVVEIAIGLVERGARCDEAGLGVLRPAVAALLPGLDVDASTPRGQVPHPVLLADGLLRLWSTLPVPRRPVLVIEDVHWAGEATWAVTDRLLRRAATHGAGVVVTSRQEGPWWPELDHAIRTGEVSGIELGPLSPAAVLDVVAGCLAVGPETVPSQVLPVVEGAGGLPLLIEEVVADLVRSGVLAPRDGGWSWRAAGPVLPRPLADATLERLRALPERDADVVRAAAVLGVAPPVDLLHATTRGGRAVVVAAVASACDVGLLQVDGATGVVEFRHELVRDAVLSSVLAADRRTMARALLSAVIGDAATDRPDEAIATAARLDDAGVALAGRLADEAGSSGVAAGLYLTMARRQLRRGLPLAAAAAAAASARLTGGPGAARASALTVQVEGLALAGEVDRAMASAEVLDAVSADARAGVRVAVARALAARGDWMQADQELALARGPSEPPTVTALAALVALERGHPSDAEAWARRVLEAAPDEEGTEDAAARCQALEVLGRLARGRDLDDAQALFRRCARVAEASGLNLWRARALHEDATIGQLRSLDVTGLRAARRAAVEAGAPGLVGSVDFHLAAVHGVRFESSEALASARGLLTDARAQGAARMQAWAWVLIGQAHAVGGARAQAEAAAREAVAQAQGDREVKAVASGTGRALPALLAEDLPLALDLWRDAVDTLRSLPSLSPLPPWYLWSVLATVADLEGDGGLAARAEAADPRLRLLPGVDACRLLAEAVAAGRRDDPDAAATAAAAARLQFDRVPAFAGWRHLAHRWVAAEAIDAGWGEPALWMAEAADWFTDRGFHVTAAVCRGLARKAGAPQRRRGRGDSQVPPHLDRVGVTSREMDVLTLLAEGLTNAQIATRLHLSPLTVKGYVERLLAKTEASNRTQLATRLTSGH